MVVQDIGIAVALCSRADWSVRAQSAGKERCHWTCDDGDDELMSIAERSKRGEREGMRRRKKWYVPKVNK